MERVSAPFAFYRSDQWNSFVMRLCFMNKEMKLEFNDVLEFGLCVVVL